MPPQGRIRFTQDKTPAGANQRGLRSQNEVLVVDSANKVATNSADINVVAAQKAFVIAIVAVFGAGYQLEVA